MDYKILNTISGFSDKAKKILESFGEVDYSSFSYLQLKDKIADYDILVVGFGLQIDKAIINRAKKLKVIACPVTGIDHIDLEATAVNNIVVLSLKGETEFLNNVSGTAELAFGLMISLSRGIPFAFDSVRDYKWQRDDFLGRSLQEKTLGIVGFGRLGRMMARYGLAFGMNVLAFDINNQSLVEADVAMVDFDFLLKKSDAISIHIPLNAQTEKMFNGMVFSKMKEGVFLINTSRGKIIDEKALLDFLANKKIAGYATDVLTDELNFSKGFNPNSLVEYAKKNKNVIITPHIGGMTFESREATDIFIANKLGNFLAQKN